MCMAWACLNRPTRECIVVARYKGTQACLCHTQKHTHHKPRDHTPEPTARYGATTDMVQSRVCVDITTRNTDRYNPNKL